MTDRITRFYRFAQNDKKGKVAKNMPEQEEPRPDDLREIPLEQDLLPRVSAETALSFRSEISQAEGEGTMQEKVEEIQDRLKRHNPEIMRLLIEMYQEDKSTDRGQQY